MSSFCSAIISNDCEIYSYDKNNTEFIFTAVYFYISKIKKHAELVHCGLRNTWQFDFVKPIKSFHCRKREE